MSDVMLLGVLRGPHKWPLSPLQVRQLVDRARQAADRIESDADEIARLRAEVEAEQSRSAMYADLVRRTAEAMGLTQADGWDKLPEKVEALRADAERWRFARHLDGFALDRMADQAETPSDFDAAIDAAMRADK